MVVRVLAVLGLLLAPTALVPPAAGVVLPQADLQITGSVEEGPPGGGIDTGDTMVYDLTIRNNGPAPIPADSLLLVLFVDRADSADQAVMEVARFNAGGDLVPASGGACGNGTRLVVQCTNRQALAEDEEIRLRIGHRHPEALAGALTFVAEVSGSRYLFDDPNAGNNSFRGPTYGFLDPPTTTTTSTTSTTTTTTDPTTSTTMSDTSTTSTSASTTTSESTTTSSSSTTTTSTTSTTTTTSTTSTTAPPTTTSSTVPSTTTTTLEALANPDSLPTSASVQGVGDSTGEVPEDEAVAAPSIEEPSDGLPFLALAALAALFVLLGGVGLGLYAYLNRPPPLVDIRRFE